MNATLTAFLGFVAWALFLVTLMEFSRFKFILTGAVAANQFRPDNSNLPPFLQRLARAHANCIEGLPIFGGLLILAALTGRASITDPLAYAFLAARILQSLIHISSVSVVASWLRFFAFAVQVGIAVYWAFRLFTA